MKMGFNLSLLFALSTVVVLSSPAQAGILDWLTNRSLVDAADAIEDAIERCTEMLIGEQPGPFERQRVKNEIDQIADALIAARQSLKHQQNARRQYFAELKDKFLNTFAYGSERDLARVQIDSLTKDQSDSSDIQTFEQLFANSFENVEGDQGSPAMSVVAQKGSLDF